MVYLFRRDLGIVWLDTQLWRSETPVMIAIPIYNLESLCISSIRLSFLNPLVDQSSRYDHVCVFRSLLRSGNAFSPILNRSITPLEARKVDRHF